MKERRDTNPTDMDKLMESTLEAGKIEEELSGGGQYSIDANNDLVRAIEPVVHHLLKSGAAPMGVRNAIQDLVSVEVEKLLDSLSGDDVSGYSDQPHPVY